MDNIKELEEMRLQISELKERLERESTLNEHLLHDSLKAKMRSVHTLVHKVICMGIVGVAAWLFIGYFWLVPYMQTAIAAFWEDVYTQAHPASAE